jgi:hypothetical protein
VHKKPTQQATIPGDLCKAPDAKGLLLEGFCCWSPAALPEALLDVENVVVTAIDP